MTEPLPVPRPKRLSLSEILELLLSRGSSDRSSVTLSRNAKGETQIEVVVRTGDHGDIATPHDAQAQATEIYESLRSRYPLSTGRVGAEGGGAVGDGETH